jgi:hypothetical protein
VKISKDNLEELQKILEEIEITVKSVKEGYYNLTGGRLSVGEFWSNVLLPFLNRLTMEERFRKFINATDIESLNRRKFNLIDKANSYNYYNQIGDDEEERKEAKSIMEISSTLLVEFDRVCESLKKKISDMVPRVPTPPITDNDLKNALFTGEKEYFVGREEYMDKTIREALTVKTGSRVSIVGAGGEGKTQLAYKAMHQYINEGKFDVVIPVYFSKGLIPFGTFLSKLAEGLGKEFLVEFVEAQRQIIRSELSKRQNPLLYLDNYETISYDINNKDKKPPEDAIKINYFLNNNIPHNTSILLTSREVKNNIRETTILLKGLEKDKGKELLVTLAGGDFRTPCLFHK